MAVLKTSSSRSPDRDGPEVVAHGAEPREAAALRAQQIREHRAVPRRQTVPAHVERLERAALPLLVLRFQRGRQLLHAVAVQGVPADVELRQPAVLRPAAKSSLERFRSV